jgi:paraquat-inducible protein B
VGRGGRLSCINIEKGDRLSDPNLPGAPATQGTRTLARETHSRWPGLVWSLPLAALLVVGYLGLQALAHRGVEVTVTFDSAADAKPGDTQVVYKGLSIGRVTKVVLSNDRKHVDMTLRLDPSTKPLLRAKTQFWLVGAKPSLTDLNSLKAALAGVTIGMAPGDGAPTRSFRGTEEPPVIAPDTPGTSYQLTSSQVGAARAGASVYYHGLEVGKVTDVDLLGRNNFKTLIFVEAPYNRFVRNGTLFYNASAVQISLSGTGLSTQFAPGNAALGGGVEFDTPSDVLAQTIAPPETAFVLFSDRGRAIAGPRGAQVFYRVMFTDPVGDLEVGAPVTLRGFQIGSVTSRTLEINPDTGLLSTPVTLGIEPERLNAAGGIVPSPTPGVVSKTDQTLARLVSIGYRARLTQNPPLVGARVIELVQLAGSPKALLREGRADDQFPIIPYTSSADVTAVAGRVDDILAKVQQVPIVEIGSDVRQITARLNALLGAPEVKDSLVHLDSTLKQIDQAATEVRPKIGPLIDNLNRAADQVQALATSANAVVSGDGSTQDASLPGTLRELTDTARSLRSLADYLGRHPESLIRGKAPDK